MKTRNFNSTAQAIAQYILDNAPLGIHDRVRQDLARRASGEDTRNFLGIEFVRGDRTAECTLYVMFERVNDSYVTDENGELWHEYRVEAQPTWPSWGLADADLALMRIELMHEVTAFALRLQRTFKGPVWLRQTSKAQQAAVA